MQPYRRLALCALFAASCTRTQDWQPHDPSEEVAAGTPVALARRYRDRAEYRPARAAYTVVVERAPMHKFLAEYYRAVSLESAGRRVRVALFIDSGGYSRTNLYALADDTYLLRDVEGEYAVDPVHGAITRLGSRDVRGRFVGSFDIDSAHTWRFIPAVERSELGTEFVAP